MKQFTTPIMKHVLALALVCVFAMSEPVKAATGDPLPGDYVSGAWQLYITKFLDESGRVIDNVNGEVSHSESQGYGMLLAVAADDRANFDKIWNWTQGNLQIRDDGLAAWRWDPVAIPHVKDRNNATDGDLLIAWALLRASRKWGDPSHRSEAARIVGAISQLLVIETEFGPVLLPGIVGFNEEGSKTGPVVNLSYWVFPAIVELGQFFEEFPASELVESGIKLLEAARYGPSVLPANWVSVSDEGDIKPAPGFELLFGYDAVRIPLYLGWHTDSRPDLLAPFEKAWVSDNGTSIKVVDLESGKPVGAMTDAGYQAIVDLVLCSRGSSPDAARAKAFATTDYYPSTLHLLSLLALSERYPTCLTSQS